MLMFLVSLRWWKDHDVSQLVNKLRFHIASTIDQNGRPPRKMEGCSSKCCKYHMQNPANTMQHERVCIILYIYIYLPNVADVMRNETFYLHNAGWRGRMLKIWKYWKYHANRGYPFGYRYEFTNVPYERSTVPSWLCHLWTLLFVSLFFWPWWFRQFSFFLALRSFIRVSWLHLFICSLQPKPQS